MAIDNRDQLAQKESRHMSAQYFAVVGASSNTEKYGYKIYKYLRDIAGQTKVYPVNPNADTIDGEKCLKSLYELPDPTHTAVSIVTRPEVTIQILQAATKLKIYSIWLQPDTTDDGCLKYIHDSQIEDICIDSETHLSDVQQPPSGSESTNGGDITPPCGGVVNAALHPSILNDHMDDILRKEPSLKRQRSPSPNSSAEERPAKVTKVGPMTTQQKIDYFLSFSKFAVVGASDDPDKWGCKIYEYLKKTDKKVYPVNIKLDSVDGTAPLRSLSELPDPHNTAVSIIIPPPQTLKVLQDTKDIGIPIFWLQPGAEDSDVIQYIQKSGNGQYIYTDGSNSALSSDSDGPPLKTSSTETEPHCRFGPSLMDKVPLVGPAIAQLTQTEKDQSPSRPCILKMAKDAFEKATS